MIPARITLLATLLTALGVGTSCVDPAHDAAVDDLGDETPGIAPGPRHRAGQPCGACHGSKGPAEPELIVAGTVYATRTSTEALVGATITLQDATGARRTALTNDVGNFYIEKRAWSPTFPLHVRIELGEKTSLMQTRIGRESSCAFCHRGARPNGDPAHMPPVFLEDR